MTSLDPRISLVKHDIILLGVGRGSDKWIPAVRQVVLMTFLWRFHLGRDHGALMREDD